MQSEGRIICERKLIKNTYLYHYKVSSTCNYKYAYIYLYVYFIFRIRHHRNTSIINQINGQYLTMQKIIQIKDFSEMFNREIMGTTQMREISVISLNGRTDIQEVEMVMGDTQAKEGFQISILISNSTQTKVVIHKM